MFLLRVQVTIFQIQNDTPSAPTHVPTKIIIKSTYAESSEAREPTG